MRELDAARRDVDEAKTAADAQTASLREESERSVESLRQLEESVARERAEAEEERARLESSVRDATDKLDVSERAVFEKDAEIQSLSVKLEDARRATSDEINELRARLDASEEDKEASSRRLNETLEEAKTRTYWIDGDVGNDVPAMVELLARAEVNVTYNGAGFDLLVLKQYADDAAFDAICTRPHDILARVRDAQPGRRWPKLDTLLELNELPTKEADGLQAIRWWQEGKRELLQSYCQSDTRSTAALGLLETVCVGVERRLPNAVFGIASALAARRAEAAFECE